MSKLSTVTVNRKTWLRGEGEDNSLLFREEDGKKCCIGFMGLQCGLYEADMRVGTLEMVKDMLDEIFDNLWVKLPTIDYSFLQSNELQEMYLANDNEEYTDKEREQELNLLALTVGFQFRFIN